MIVNREIAEKALRLSIETGPFAGLSIEDTAKQYYDFLTGVSPHFQQKGENEEIS
jgi:hypothetical protein